MIPCVFLLREQDTWLVWKGQHQPVPLTQAVNPDGYIPIPFVAEKRGPGVVVPTDPKKYLRFEDEDEAIRRAFAIADKQTNGYGVVYL